MQKFVQEKGCKTVFQIHRRASALCICSPCTYDRKQWCQQNLQKDQNCVYTTYTYKHTAQCNLGIPILCDILQIGVNSIESVLHTCTHLMMNLHYKEQLLTVLGLSCTNLGSDVCIVKAPQQYCILLQTLKSLNTEESTTLNLEYGRTKYVTRIQGRIQYHMRLKILVVQRGSGQIKCVFYRYVPKHGTHMIVFH